MVVCRVKRVCGWGSGWKGDGWMVGREIMSLFLIITTFNFIGG